MVGIMEILRVRVIVGTNENVEARVIKPVVMKG